MVKSFKESCRDMTKLIESCWDENNPDDGLTFDDIKKSNHNKHKNKGTFYYVPLFLSNLIYTNIFCSSYTSNLFRFSIFYVYFI